jgi:outer membrane receptor for Fe3+-dicitrate
VEQTKNSVTTVLQLQTNGFRPNSDFESKNYFANLNYQLNDKTSLHFDYTYFNYLAQQAGGLTDVMFNKTRHRAIDLETGLR